MKELKNDLASKDFKKCYLFYGEETYLINKYENAFVKAILNDDQKDMNLNILNDENLEVDNLLSIVETYPFFAEKRVVIVRDSNFFQKGTRKDEGAKFIPFVENLSDYSVLIFVENKVEKNNALYKAINKHHVVVEFAKLDNKKLASWINKEVKKNNLTISNQALNYFIDNMDNSMEQIFNELQKLFNFKSTNEDISINDINEVCSLSLESRVFELTRFSAEGNVVKACEIYKHLLTTKEPVFVILYLLTRQFRNMLIAKSLKNDNATNKEISQILGVQEFIVSKILNQSNRFSLSSLKKIMILAQETDQNIKQGLIKDDVAVELFIIQLSCTIK